MHIVNPVLPARNRCEVWKMTGALQACGGHGDAVGSGSPALPVLDLERGRELRPACAEADASLADRRKRRRDERSADQTVFALTDNLKQGAAA